MAAPADTPFPWLPLLTLTAASFVAVTSEFLPTGLLPEIAGDTGVSESMAGFLVTIFAATVVVTTAPLTAVTQRVPRKALLVAVLVIFALANVFAAVAPTYELLAAARVLQGAAHGLFWAVIGPYTALLVRPEQLTKGIAVTNSGATAAFVLGIPAGTALGHALDWRAAFIVIAVLIAVLAVLVALTLPHVEHREQLATGEIPLPLRRDRTVPLVALACLTVLLMMTAQNTFSTYIVPWLLGVPGFASEWVSGLLLLQGLCGAGGLLLAGYFGDRYPKAALPTFMTGVLGALVVVALFGAAQVPAVIGLMLIPLFFGGLPALMHARVLSTASPRVRDQAAAFLAVSFNIGIGGGALLGGAVMDAGGVGALPWAQLVLWLPALALAVWTALRFGSGRRAPATIE